MPDTQPGPLANVRVIDLTDDRAIYAGKLLADLGAEVVRVEPEGGDPLRQRAPFHENGASLWHAFFASSRHFLNGDADAITDLAQSADIILDCERLSDPDALLEANPGLVIVDVTSFGRSGPWRDYQAPGLVAEALGGIAATSGDVDTPPLKLYGDQYAFVGGRLRRRRRAGRAQSRARDRRGPDCAPLYARGARFDPRTRADVGLVPRDAAVRGWSGAAAPGLAALVGRVCGDAGDRRLDHDHADARLLPAGGLAGRGGQRA